MHVSRRADSKTNFHLTSCHLPIDFPFPYLHAHTYIHELYIQSGVTALHAAVSQNHEDIVEQLLKKGADPNLKLKVICKYHDSHITCWLYNKNDTKNRHIVWSWSSPWWGLSNLKTTRKKHNSYMHLIMQMTPLNACCSQIASAPLLTLFWQFHSSPFFLWKSIYCCDDCRFGGSRDKVPIVAKAWVWLR